MQLGFHGAAETVTGSRFLLEHGGSRLLVDCGMFQGRKELRLRNWREPGFDPSSVDVVALTHAHIDHSGWLPRLVREGFQGPVVSTPATADLADVMLRDSARIQEEDAEYANRKGFSRHDPALPLYTVQDAERCLERFEPIDFGQEYEVAGSELRFSFESAGHIIGSGMVVARAAGSSIVFSGDVGRYDAPLVADPSAPPACDYLVIESTYGDREHPRSAIEEQLSAALEAVARSSGTLLVPAFAVGRSQQLMVLLHGLMEQRPELAMPIHLDSPMAIDATRIYARYPEEAGLEALELRSGSSPIYGKNVFLHRTVEESMRLNALDGPRVLIASSGMMTGGRILHHLRRLLPDRRNLLLLAGYQAPGTRGWRIQRGEEFVRIHGRDVHVKAQVARISGLSAHADADQLLRWVRDLPPPRRTFVVHGDDGASEALAGRLEQELGHRCTVPRHGEQCELG